MKDIEVNKDDLLKILNHYWKYDAFRNIQYNVIENILKNNDTLVLMPTGGGKSICFQVPALVKEGVCIVISPLIALMKDQVDSLKNKGISAEVLHSGLSYSEIDDILNQTVYGKIKFLYLSPERLLSDIIKTRVQLMKISYLVVDEAHCISEWGYDFRPAYLLIKDFKLLIPQIPVVALTATAPNDIKKDIINKLELNKNLKIFSHSLERNNIIYAVRNVNDKISKVLEILKKINGSAIVYVKNRKETQEISSLLLASGISADYYHAGMKYEDRSLKQKLWINNRIRVIVATNAFGMGIDKPDVRIVIHFSAPESIESYYQEAGRAGRDGNKSYAVLLYNSADEEQVRLIFEQNFPSIDDIKTVYHALGNYLRLAIGTGDSLSLDLNLIDFCNRYNFNISKVLYCFSFLEKDGYLFFSKNVYQASRIKFLMDNNELYRFQVENLVYDIPIKIILRSYAGLFDSYVTINESVLAERTHIELNKYIFLLNKLNEFGVIHYIPNSDSPRITFLQPRIDSKKMFINNVYVASRKKTYLDKLDSIFNYATQNEECRSVVLLRYFNQDDVSDCGVCDVCIKNRSDKNIDAVIKSKIISMLKEQKNIRLDFIKNTITEVPYEKLYNIISLMVSEDIICLLDDQSLQLKQ